MTTVGPAGERIKTGWLPVSGITRAQPAAGNACSTCPAACTTRAPNRWPGARPNRRAGPEMDTAARSPSGPRTGADTEARPLSRSPTLAAQPCRRIRAMAGASNPGRDKDAPGPTSPGADPGADAGADPGEDARCPDPGTRSPAPKASSTLAAEPAVIGRMLPTGTVSRSPEGRSAAATHTRTSPRRTYSCALSPVSSRNRRRTGMAVAGSASGRAIRGPRRNRLLASRAASPWCSSATASRWTVARGIPVRVTSSASDAGSALITSRIATALSSTPIPLSCSMH